MTLRIIGGGLAGLLAANLLRHRDPIVIEASPSIPNNLSAVFRFPSPAVGDAVGIPFRKVNVIKDTLKWKGPIQDAAQYSMKVLGEYDSSRSISLPQHAESGERWIAPPDLISRLAARVKMELGTSYSFHEGEEKVISTIPMPKLMELLGYQKKINFKYREGVNVRAKIYKCNFYATMYVPAPSILFSRVSITGNELIIEHPGLGLDEVDCLDSVVQAAHVMGIDFKNVHSETKYRQTYAKILPVDDQERRAFIFYASTMLGRAFSLGRFATWRPGLLMEDLLKDIRLIDSWIDKGTPGSSLHHDLHYLGGSK